MRSIGTAPAWRRLPPMVKSVLFMAALGVALLALDSNAGPVGVMPGRILVKARGGDHPKIVTDALTPYSGRNVDEIAGLNIYVADVPQQAWKQALDELRRNPN